MITEGKALLSEGTESMQTKAISVMFKRSKEDKMNRTNSIRKKSRK